MHTRWKNLRHVFVVNVPAGKCRHGKKVNSSFEFHVVYPGKESCFFLQTFTSQNQIFQSKNTYALKYNCEFFVSIFSFFIFCVSFFGFSCFSFGFMACQDGMLPEHNEVSQEAMSLTWRQVDLSHNARSPNSPDPAENDYFVGKHKVV